ncbi:unnamed protein product [Moneuplotes crassus]|uniref:Amino acid transporter transmembrane domain-containing protein n=2 Tax=Euplotes crassus TaxID=5936 RepID=A0AAD1UG09_EUPCR|nr:unnamed protein product [Moneuplotes crassus]
MDKEFHLVEDLEEPLLDKEENKDEDFESKRILIMSKREQKKRDINKIDENGHIKETDTGATPLRYMEMDDRKALAQYNMKSSLLPYLTSPHSPVYKFAKVVTSPAIYIQKKIRPGGIKGSIFNLICGVLGTGMLTLPVVCLQNGILLGSALIVAGVLLTAFCGMCIVVCSEKTQTDSLEFIAHIAFGHTIGRITSYSMIMCQLGFVTSYIIVVKTLIPSIIKRLMDGALPSVLSNDKFVQISIATIYSLLFLLPLSLPRKMGALRFTSLFGFACCIFLVIVICCIFFFDKAVVPDPLDNITEANYLDFSFASLFTSFPFIISSYMYQPMIPAIYKNLENRNMQRMEKVVYIGSFGAVFLYILISVFGYLSFSTNPEQLEILRVKQNILELDFKHNVYFEASIICLVVTIMSAGPLCMLPVKDCVEDLIYKNEIMTDSQNVMVTLLLTGICYAAAIVIPSIGDVLSILGLSCNPYVGFFLPILCYLKLEDNKPIYMMLAAILILFITGSFSILGIYGYVTTKIM